MGINRAYQYKDFVSYLRAWCNSDVSSAAFSLVSLLTPVPPSAKKNSLTKPDGKKPLSLGVEIFITMRSIS